MIRTEAVEAVIFDLDETLHARAPSLVRFAQQLHAQAQLDIDKESFVETFVRLDGRGNAPNEGLFQHLAREFDLGVPVEDIVAKFQHTAWNEPTLYPDAVSTLEQLHHHKLGIVTNGSEITQAAKIANSGLDRLTDAVVISGVLGVKKPSPAIFDEMCRQLDVAPSRCVMVGDSPEHDIGGGRSVGMQTIWVARQPWPEDWPRDYDAVVQEVGEIVSLLTDDKLREPGRS